MNTHHNQPYLQNLGTQSVHVLSSTTIIGRHQDCNLVLKSERGASRKHARITVQNGAVVLMDLGSLNGTLVNGREISRAVQLADGDIVIFDEQEYRFTNSAVNAQNVSDNVTVIANKDEIGRPERIKPAIRLVETAPPLATNDDDETSLDETAAWDSLASNLDQIQSTERDQEWRQNEEEQNTNPTKRDQLTLQDQAANDQPLQEQIKQQPQRLQVQELQAQQPQTQVAQIHGSRAQEAPMSWAQESPAQESQAQESQTHKAQESPPQAAPVQELHSQDSQDRQLQPQEQRSFDPNQQEEEADAFEWRPGEPPAIRRPAEVQQHEQQHEQQPVPRQAQQIRDPHSAPNKNFDEDQHKFRPFPVTPRPGGDERSTRPGLQKYYPYHSARTKKTNWTLWLVVVPLITLFALGAIYLAYSAGFSAGSTASSTPGFS